mgnify:CR=1 FL=1
MVYSFDIDVAKEYGVNEAIMIANLQFWITKNKANNKGYYNNHYWTYNSKNALQKLFPFWTERQIRYILDNLINKGVLITANYNKNKYDKTLWYAFVDEEKWIKVTEEKSKNTVPIDVTNLSNQKDEKVQAIPYNNTNNNIYNNNINNNNMSEFDNSDPLPLHFKELWNQLADSYKEQYPRNQKIPRITTGEIKNLYQRDKELKKFVKELISDGIITEKDIDGDIWHWALKQVWMRIQNNEFLRGECKPTEAHPKPFVLRADIFLRPSNFISMISPNNTKWDKHQGYGLKW